MPKESALTTTQDLHTGLIDQVRADGWIVTPGVEDAMRAVPRHLFLPNAPAQEAYADKNVATKTDPGGAVLSSASTPSIVAMMLEQAGIGPGHRVLEIGAGTGYNRSITFQRVGDRLVSQSVKLCGFIPMRNDNGELILDIAEGVALRFDEDQNITSTALDSILDQPRTEAWSEVTVGVEPIHGIWGRLVVAEAGTCRISADDAAVQSGRAVPVIPSLSPAVVQGASLAYLTHRPIKGHGQKRSELGAIGHGPAGDELCRRIIEQVHRWDTDRADRLVVAAFAAGTPDDQLPEARVIDKRRVRLSVSWA